MSTIEIHLTGLDKIQELYRKAPARMRTQMTKALEWSAILVQRHEKEEAPVDSGQLRSSINIRHLHNAVAIVAGAKHGIFVHQGTGIYGPRRQMITPRGGKKVLAWKSGGQWHFARKIKGIKPNPFAKRAVRRSETQINQAFAKAIANVINGRA